MNTKPRHCAICLVIVALLLSGCAPGTPPEPAATPTPRVALTLPGLVLYYPFDGNAKDVSGNGNDGQVNGATLTEDRFCNANRAYRFDGIDDSISFDASKVPAGTSSRTISAWIKAESFPAEVIPGIGSRATVIGWGADDWQKLSEMQIVNGRLQFHCYDTWGRDLTSDAVLELDQWYHLVIAYEAGGAVFLYVNGVEDKSGPGSIDTPVAVGRIGAYPDPQTHGFDGSYFHGTIDDVSVYDRVLSAAEVRALYTSATPIPAAPPAPAPTAAGSEIITVMTYNIENGGGVGPTDPSGPWCCGPPPRGCCGAARGNRLPRMLEVIKAADPDILGIQEAFLWQLNDDAIAREVAAELGMSYLIGESGDPNGAHVVLFTRLDIVHAEGYPGCFETGEEPGRARAGLRAELVTDSGRTLHVFVVHLRPYAPEVSFLLEQMRPYLDDTTLLLGDMNFTDPSDQAAVLRDAGWRHPLAEYQFIDQIWTSPALEAHVQPGPLIPVDLTVGASDHPPFVVRIAIDGP